jgi:hypothetical protein
MTPARILCLGAATVLLAAPAGAFAKPEARYPNPIELRDSAAEADAQPVDDFDYGDREQAQVGAPVDTVDVESDSAGKVVVNHTITNGPVPDTPRSRAAYGGPMSRAGNETTPAGN